MLLINIACAFINAVAIRRATLNDDTATLASDLGTPASRLTRKERKEAIRLQKFLNSANFSENRRANLNVTVRKSADKKLNTKQNEREHIAFKFIYRANVINGKQEKGNVFDLHGFSKSLALVQIAKWIELCKEHYVYTVIIITGQGNGSPDGIPVLRPAILDELVNDDIKSRGMLSNPGRILIMLHVPAAN
jgi:DNA-nicking Smr family endonuclease